MEAYDEEGMAVAAAKILLSLRNRRLRRSPEWAPRPSEEPSVASAAVEVLQPLQVWPKRRRSPPHALAKEKSKAATTWTMAAQNLGASLEHGAGAGSAASSSGEDVPRSPPRAREKPKVKVEVMAARMPERPLYYGAAAGSGPTTSGVDRARSQLRPRPRSSEKAQAKVAARKEAMAAPSPETPLDYAVYAAAAGSGASSSGEDGARSPAKRKAPGAGGSGGASSGDEGCSSPSKRTRGDAAAGDCAGQATAAAVKGSVAAVKVEEPKIESESSSNRDENGMLLFDLNEDLNISWVD